MLTVAIETIVAVDTYKLNVSVISTKVRNFVKSKHSVSKLVK